MKQTIILAAAIFLLGTGASAQKAHFGIKGGMNASTLSYKPSNNDLQTKIGLNAGLLAHIHGSNAQWAIQPEIYYSGEGVKSESNSKNKLNLDYLNVPVLLQYMFDNGFRIEAGPQIGFLLNAKSKAGSTSVDVKDDYEKTNFSVPVGIGYLTTSGLGFDARYNFGITNINNKNNATKIRSDVFQFGIFYQFSDPKIKK